jgi:PAS domain S-box-containing protein
LSTTGIELVGNVPWGTHFCQFFETRQDLLDLLVPYFRAGLERNELCLWITAEPLGVDEARKALAASVPELDERFARGQIEILDHREWYAPDGRFRADDLLAAWVDRVNLARTRGFAGLRLSGNISWLESTDWRAFAEYEEKVNGLIGQHPMIALCSYSLGNCGALEVIDVVANHQFALIKREGSWVLVEGAENRKTAQALRESEARYRGLYEAISGGIVVQNSRGEIVDANPKVREILGLTLDQMRGRTSMDPRWRAINEDGSPAPGEEHPAVVSLRTGRAVRGRVLGVFHPGDGDFRWLDVNSEPILDPTTREVQAVVVTFFDITARKKAEEALRASEERYRSLFEGMTEGFALHEIVCDERGEPCDYRFLDVNPAFERLTGLSREAVVGKTMRGVLPGEDPAWIRAYGAVALTGAPVHFDHEATTLGRHFDVFAYRPAPKQFAVLFVDITERKAMERALAASEREFRAMFELSAIGSAQADPRTGRFERVNQRFCEITGYSEEELRGKSFVDLTHPDDRERDTDAVARALRGESRVWSSDKRYVRRDGTVIWVTVDGCVLRDAAGSPVRTLAMIQDVTIRKRAEAAREEQLRRLDLLLRASADVLEALDRESLFERVAQAARELTGAKAAFAGRELGNGSLVLEGAPGRGDGPGRSAFGGLSRGWECVQETLFAKRESLRWTKEEVEAELPEERPSWNGLVGVRLVHADGRPSGMILAGDRQTGDFTFEDEMLVRQLASMTSLALQHMDARRGAERLVDERTAELAGTVEQLEGEIRRRTLAERSLEERSQLLEAFFKHTATPLVFLDSKLNFVRVNEAYARACARDVSDFPGRNHFDLYPHSENQAIFEEVVRTGKAHRAVAKPFAFPDHPEWGVTYWDWMLTPLVDERGEVESLVFSLEDVTARTEAERKLQELNEALARRASQLRRLALELSQAEHRERQRLAAVLHDHLQQFLVGAKFGIDVLQKQNQDEMVRQGAAQVAELLDQSIAISKSLAVELFPPILRERGLTPALVWLARWMEEKHGLAVTVERELEIGPDREGIDTLVFQSVRELLFNVSKHSGVKAAKVRIGRGEGEEIRIEVSDRGGGMSPSEPGAGEAGGGFGLFSIRERLELLGGRVEIESAAGSGTSVTLVFDHPGVRARSEGAAEEGRRSRDGQKEESMSGSPSKPRVRVLLVDDHAILRTGLSRLLREEPDFEVVGEAGDGPEAVEMARALRPDVVIMDVSLPGMTGIEATRLIRSESPKVRVIGLSMYEEAEAGAAILEAGAAAYLNKAGPSSQLIAAIRHQGVSKDVC